MTEPPYTVFLSHSGKDKTFVEELHRRLDRDGVRSFYDVKSIGWGENWVRALERAIDECKHIVFVLSPDFFNSKWAEVERTSSIADDPSGLERKVRPLLLHPCDHLSNFPRFLRHIQSIDVSTQALFEQNYPEICRELGGEPQPDLAPHDRTQLPPVHPLPARHWMPFHSLGDKFVGRIDAIWALHDSLHQHATTILQGIGVVAGTGGLGKTQLAIEYAHRFGAAYTGGVFWVNAERGLTELITRISETAAIKVDSRTEEPVQVAHLWHHLNARHLPCLIILDNLPENVALRPYLPTTGRIHTIVTTRRQDLQQATVRLAVLTLQASVELLNSGPRQLGPGAKLLAERLGCLPLALELAKSYLNDRTDLTIPTLIEEIDSQGELEVLKEFAAEYRDQLPSHHELDIVSTFQLSWRLASDPAKAILRVMGELAPAPVPRKLLRLILDLPEQSPLQDRLSKGISELARLSLVELSGNGDPAAHRLILAFAHHRNAVDDASSPFDRCTEVVREQMKKAHRHPDAKTTRELESLLPHAESLTETSRLTPEHFGALLNSVATHHQTMGRFTAAQYAFRAALASDENSFVPGHPTIAIKQSNLARVLEDLGQFDEARDLLRKALASNKRSFKPGHPTIARTQSNLALVLKDMGQLKEARDLLREAMASDERSFEPGHPTIATRQSSLALVFIEMGQLGEARELLCKALASNERSFEAGHPIIAANQSNLAIVLRRMEQLDEARDLLGKALASDEKSFEAGHPTIAVRKSNLALVLKDMGQFEKARGLLHQALASDEKSFEPGHPSIAIRQWNLATVLKNLGQFGEARELLLKSQATFLARLGPDHPNTKAVTANLRALL